MSEKPKYLIKKHGAFYRPNESGYTGSAIQAGRYTLEEAESITHPNGKDGPRDGMSYIHEDDVNDEDWKAYKSLLEKAQTLSASLNDMIPNEVAWKEQSRQSCLIDHTVEALKTAREAMKLWKESNLG